MPGRFMYDDQTIKNVITGQIVKFLTSDTGSDTLEMESLYLPFSIEPPVHYHPYQDEYIKVLEGELTVRMDGEINIYRSGSAIHIKKNTRHSIWNSGFRETIVNWKVDPALETAEFLRTMTQLSNSGETDVQGVPSLHVMVYLLRKYNKIFRLEQPREVTLRMLYLLFSPVFCLKKFRKKFNNPLKQSTN
ncbi:cupin domain-containing protein [Chitinophaga silvatica]|uniref:Cupin domain-containing protein n=1 Tax=Chitinophaga silvatica TaxID=2282649 RepID=A0A3E1YA35_9BACT|nr:cupin domain-containing protein [Chitinophaga silvatica]RFS22570.1 cupin domain-containing protein [Chitinophaga silvatica]